jgi:hypothetical protein
VIVAVGVGLLLAKRRHDNRVVSENAAEFADEHPDEAARFAEACDDDEK